MGPFLQYVYTYNDFQLHIKLVSGRRGNIPRPSHVRIPHTGFGLQRSSYRILVTGVLIQDSSCTLLQELSYMSLHPWGLIQGSAHTGPHTGVLLPDS